MVKSVELSIKGLALNLARPITRLRSFEEIGPVLTK